VSDPQLAAFEAAISNRWVIDGTIGRGSRATVYRARDVDALSTLDAGLASGRA
jgi:hypothetical protein